MKSKLILSFLLLLLLQTSGDSQTIYQLKYKSPIAGDTATYDAFFSLSSNGSGIARINSSANDATAEMEIQEQYAWNPDGTIDTSVMLYGGTSPTVVKGNTKAIFAPVAFWFKLADTLYEPWAVSDTSTKVAPSVKNFLSVDFIKSQDMPRNKKLVLTYFADTSAYYKYLFDPTKSKGTELSLEERKKYRMFLLVVASTEDPHLKPNALIDARKVMALFSNIAKDVLGIRLYADSVYGNKYSKASVEAALKRIVPTKNDIVVFYYSGHGFTDRKRSSKDFPFIDLRDPTKTLYRRDLETQTMNIQDIYDTIVKKGARLNLVLSDCCNDTIAAPKVVGPKWPFRKGLTKHNLENLKKLFIKDSANLLMTAASKDERATVTPSFNSYFTNFFLESLKTWVSPEKGYPNWYRVMADAQNQTRSFASNVPCPKNSPCPNGKTPSQTPKIFFPK